MKYLFILIITGLSINSYAASQFTWSGETISTIFNSSMVWKKIGGNVESIVFKGYADKVTTYSVTTTENIDVINENGHVIDTKNVACTVIVDVKAVGDELAPTLEVSKVDFTSCPEHMGK